MEKPFAEGFSFVFGRCMGYRTQNVRALSPKELLSILHNSAMLYSEYADTTLLFIFREKRESSYDYYEVRFGKNNFMHLAGIKSESLSATEFYNACLEGRIVREDCNPRRDAKTMYLKVAIMEQLLDLRNSKCYKIGEKDLVTRDNDFEMATGNANGVMGYDSRIKIKGTDGVDKSKAPIPTTLLNNSITDYCTKPQKIMFILQRTDKESTYSTLFYEIKKGLFQTEKEYFSEEIKALLQREKVIPDTVLSKELNEEVAVAMDEGVEDLISKE